MSHHYAVVGNPVQHSLSPGIFKQFAAQTQQDMVYERLLVPLDALEKSVDIFQAAGGKGCNVTLPFKQSIFALLDEVSEAAALARAVNTITFLPNGKRLGDNTDGAGLLRDIHRNIKFSLANKRILLIGAGGAARGILPALIQQGPSELIIVNRTLQKAVQLSHAFSIDYAEYSNLKNKKFDCIINASSASLFYQDLALPENIIQSDALCYDLVYGQKDTPFMAWARRNGAASIYDGWGMLIEQAALSFYIWRGIMPLYPFQYSRIVNRP
jgi:shikimate dehydrogenase